MKALQSNIKPNAPKRYKPVESLYQHDVRQRRNVAWYKEILLLSRGPIVCGICEAIIDYDVIEEALTIDHIIPISKGGSNDGKNLQPAHRTCNQLKGNQLPKV